MSEEFNFDEIKEKIRKRNKNYVMCLMGISLVTVIVLLPFMMRVPVQTGIIIAGAVLIVGLGWIMVYNRVRTYGYELRDCSSKDCGAPGSLEVVIFENVTYSRCKHCGKSWKVVN